jgi:hypothetical protein
MSLVILRKSLPARSPTTKRQQRVRPSKTAEMDGESMGNSDLCRVLVFIANLSHLTLLVRSSIHFLNTVIWCYVLPGRCRYHRRTTGMTPPVSMAMPLPDHSQWMANLYNRKAMDPAT